ncbi:MAG: M15 family metallopeptidase [Allosphingosinicella sp.]
MANVGEVLGGLDPLFRDRFLELLDRCRTAGFRVVPYDGARSPWQQAIYWRQSRTRTEVLRQIEQLRNDGAEYIAQIMEEVGPHSGRHVTDAIPGKSFHQYRRAVDSYIESPDTRRALWRERAKDEAEYDLAVDLYERLGEIAESLELTWGGRWSIGDFGHVQQQLASSPLEEFGSWLALDAALKEAWPHP